MDTIKMWHGVYVYTTDVKKVLGRFKVGKADRKAETIEEAAMIRIREQFTAGNRDEKIELINVFNADDAYMIEFHKNRIAKLYKELEYAETNNL